MSATVWQRTISALLLALVALLGLTVSTGAQPASRSVSWQRYDVDLQIQADGTLAVTETQAITFTGRYQQGYRLVPLDRATGASNVSVPEVTNGQSLAYTRGSAAEHIELGEIVHLRPGWCFKGCWVPVL